MKDYKAAGRITPTINDDVNLKELTREVIRKVQEEIEMRRRTLRNFQDLMHAGQYERGMTEEEVKIRINTLNVEIQQLRIEEQTVAQRERQNMMQDRIMPDSRGQLEEIRKQIQSNQEKKEEIQSEYNLYKTIRYNPFQKMETYKKRLKELQEELSGKVIRDEPEGAEVYRETYEEDLKNEQERNGMMQQILRNEQERNGMIQQIEKLNGEFIALQESKIMNKDKVKIGREIQDEIERLTTILSNELQNSERVRGSKREREHMQASEIMIQKIETLYAELDTSQRSALSDSSKSTLEKKITKEIEELTKMLNAQLNTELSESSKPGAGLPPVRVMQINQEIEVIEVALQRTEKDIQELRRLNETGEIDNKISDNTKRTGFFEVAEDGVITLKTYSDMKECGGKVVDKYIIYPKEGKIYLKMEQTGGIQVNMKQLTDKEDLYRMHNEFKVCNAVCVASDALRSHNDSHSMLRKEASNYRNGFVSMLRKPHSREMLYNQDHLSIIRSAAGALNGEYGNIGRFDSCFGPSIKEQKKTARKVERKVERKMTQRLRQQKAEEDRKAEQEEDRKIAQQLGQHKAEERKEKKKTVRWFLEDQEQEEDRKIAQQSGQHRAEQEEGRRIVQQSGQRRAEGDIELQNLSTGQVGREKSRNKNRKKTIGSCIQQ